MKLFLFFFIMNVSTMTTITAQEGLSSNDLYGIVTEIQLNQKNYKWLNNNINDIFPDTIIQQLSHINIKHIYITLLIGTWCSDTQIELHKILHLLHKINLDKEHLTIFALDKNKTYLQKNGKVIIATKVPTLIVHHKGQMLGKIVEYPSFNWAEDLLHILEDF